MIARLSAALFALLFAITVQAAITASLDNDQIDAGDSVRLTLQYDGQTSEAPNLAPLQQDFDVLSTNRSNNLQIINGSVSSHTETQLVLAPKRAGKLVVPAITWGREQSAPIALTVNAGGGAARGAASGAAGDKVFLETIVDQQQPFVQAAVNVTVRVYTAEPLYQANLEFAGSGEVLVQQVGADQTRKIDKDGRPYDVVERHYVLFPQKSGELKLPGAVLSGQLAVRLRPAPLGDPFADLFGSNGGMVAGSKPIRVHGDDVALDVRPRPPGAGSGYWLPARDVTLTAQWHPDSAEVQAGDPITLELNLRAQGLTAAQLPDLAALLVLPPGLKAYPDQAKLDNAAQNEVVVGTRTQSIALIADQPGEFKLPALHLEWWDTSANRVREVVLPGRTLTILPAAASASAASAPNSAAAHPAAAGSAPPPTPTIPARGAGLPWTWISLALGCLWIATLVAWWLSRRKAPVAAPSTPDAAPSKPVAGPVLPPAAAQARAEYRAACQRNDAAIARRALLAWALAVWPDAPQGLAALGRRLGDERIATRLAELDRACFAGASWDGAALLAVLEDLPAPARPARTDKGKLAPLYR